MRRDLPWRAKAGCERPLDPYHILVSETMLQQTQVATVIPYYHRFLDRFPTVAHLAAADHQEVLRLWQGLGYYSRARNLQAAAQHIIAHHNGNVPSDPDQLLQLPGVGRYTAGAVASIAFGKQSPILDGNVQRVLCRLDAIETDPRDRQIQKILWKRAREILPRQRVGDFNSALMELGATVCTPRNPQCLLCPVREHCQAAAAGVQELIPPRKRTAPTPHVIRHAYCIESNDHWLIEQRPSRGRWAGMWQFITVDPEKSPELPCKVSGKRRLGSVSHSLTHRRYEFDVFRCQAVDSTLPRVIAPRAWIKLDQISQYPLSGPQLKIVQMLADFFATVPKR